MDSVFQLFRYPQKTEETSHFLKPPILLQNVFVAFFVAIENENSGTLAAVSGYDEGLAATPDHNSKRKSTINKG
jgi:hypothetical protein